MIIDRILTAFNKNIGLEKRDAIWDWCVDIIKNTGLTEENLDNFTKNNLTQGIFGGSSTEINRRIIIKLAEGLGVVGINNPEGIQHGLYPKMFGRNFTDADLLRMIETKIGFKLKMPEFIGNLDIPKTEYGIITDRHCHYLWIMKRIMELCPDRNVGIIEIGAGIGLLPYFLNQQGYKDYTAIDLSYSNAIQTYFIHKNMPERKLILSGEIENPFSFKYRNHIKILHSSDFKDIPRDRYFIMINTDGLTEMGIDEAKKYFNSDCASLLLSINHEVNNYRIIELSGNTRRLIYRFPFWIREGYVEELYKSL